VGELTMHAEKWTRSPIPGSMGIGTSVGENFHE
jgi:hypothetical protein